MNILFNSMWFFFLPAYVSPKAIHSLNVKEHELITISHENSHIIIISVSIYAYLKS